MKLNIQCCMRHRIRYETENVRCVAQNVRCRIRYATNRHCTWNMRHRMLHHGIRNRTSDVRYRTLRYSTFRGFNVVLRYRMSGRTILVSYVYDIVRPNIRYRTCITVYVSIIRYRRSDIRYRRLARIQMELLRPTSNRPSCLSSSEFSESSESSASPELSKSV
jgi:hypothetical protein